MSSKKLEKKQIKITRADLEGPLERTGHIYEVERIGDEVEFELVDDSDDENDDENEIVILGGADTDDDDDDDGLIADVRACYPIAKLYEYLDDFAVPDNSKMLRILVSRSATPDEVSKAIKKQSAIQEDPVDGDLSRLIRELENLTELARETYRRVYTQAAN